MGFHLTPTQRAVFTSAGAPDWLAEWAERSGEHVALSVLAEIEEQDRREDALLEQIVADEALERAEDDRIALVAAEVEFNQRAAALNAD